MRKVQLLGAEQKTKVVEKTIKRNKIMLTSDLYNYTLIIRNRFQYVVNIESKDNEYLLMRNQLQGQMRIQKPTTASSLFEII